MIDTVFVWNAYNNAMQQYDAKEPRNLPSIIELNKFFLLLFNHFIYHYEISRSLAISTNLGFSKFYVPEYLLIKNESKSTPIVFC